MAWSPDCPGTWRRYPPAVHPHPAAAAPRPTTRRPHHSRPGSSAPCLEPGSRRHSRRYQHCVGRRRPPAPSRPWTKRRLGICAHNPRHQRTDENNHFSPFHKSPTGSFPI